METSKENKIIARSLVSIFGGKPSVNLWWDERETTSVAILKCADAPQRGVASYATVNLSDHPVMMDGKPYPARVEIVGACAAETGHFPNVISTCAFYIIKDKWFIAPGVIYPDIVTMYPMSKTLAHVMFVPPFLWDERLKTMTFESKTVAFLMAVPISEMERRYAEEHGAEALETLFEDKQIDVFDIDRPSVV